MVRSFRLSGRICSWSPLRREKSQGPVTDKMDHCSASRTGVLRGLSRLRSRSPTTVTACQFAHSPSRPEAAQGTTRLSMEVQMGGSPEASATASGRGNQPLKFVMN